MTTKSKAHLTGAVSLIALVAMGTPLAAEGVKTSAQLGENIETAPGALPPQGFVFTVDGRPKDGDQSYTNAERRADIRLDRNDVTVTFDGLGAVAQLDALILNPKGLQPGDLAQFQSRINYPAFVERGEIRLYSGDGKQLVSVTPIAANGSQTIALPQGNLAEGDLAYSYRVYDAKGRYDETRLQPISEEAARPVSRIALQDEGRDNTARRAIPIRGGAVTVHARNLQPGFKVAALGTEATAGVDRAVVINRILPVGTHEVEVTARGTSVIRPITIPASDWFVTGVADLTLGRRSGGFQDLGQGRDIRTGRLQGYANGHTASGWHITASADTQEDELKNLLSNITKRDPRAVLSRLDPDLYYPTYGDDSQIVDTTPTASGIYLKAERGGNHAVLGNFKSSLRNTELLRNERALYGMQGVYQTESQTSRGEARAAVELFAAQPEQLPRRDQFRATGGSSYFLSVRDVVIGSETLQLEIRDPDTGRLIERKALAYGRDYEINYAQGLVMLRSPLSSFARDGSFIAGTGQDGYYLVAQYEYTPAFEDMDGNAYGGRAEAWVSNALRLGVTGALEQTGEADQTATGFDLRLALGDNSYVQLEQAETDGPGFGSTFSADGGMNVSQEAAQGGTGQAQRLDAQLDTQELGLGFEGALNLSYEAREAGFATIDRQTTRDEQMGEISLLAKLDAANDLRLKASQYDEDAADQKTELSAEWGHQLSQKSRVDLGYYHLDRLDSDRDDRSGTRDDLGLRLSHQFREDLRVYGFGIATLSHSGQIAKGDRLGLGAEWQFAQNWSVTGEISDGDAGASALAHLSYETATGSAYLGYELEADRDDEGDTRRTLGRDQGKFVWGGRTRVGESLTLLNENSYDMFGNSRSTTSAYGAEYAQHSQLTHDMRYEYGRVHDRGENDVIRHALSFGSRYDNKAGLAVRGRIELRRDQEQPEQGLTSVEDSLLLSGNLRYDLDESRRLLASAELLRSDGGAEDSRDYTDITLGYALRPVEHDRWTLLAKYQYFYDLYGQTVSGSESRGPRQRSHVFSLDGSYQISDNWTLGGKIGGRLSQSQQSGQEWRDNNAYLGVINARYHLLHKWDAVIEARHLTTQQAGLNQTGLMVAGYRHIGEHSLLGVGYNFSQFSDDLTDLVYDDKGLFVNLVLKY